MSRRIGAAAALLLALVVVRPAQGQDSTLRLSPGALTAADAALPVDRIADLLAFLPGVVSLNDGDLSVHGAGRNALGTYLDGMPITPGHRSGRSPLLGGSWFGASGAGAAIGTNAFSMLLLRQAPGSAERGGARGGVIEVESRIGLPGQRPALHGSWATDAAGGTAHGLGFNRLQLNAEGGAGRFTGAVAGFLEGQSSARLGLEQNASPVYLASGVDTAVTVSGPGGTTSVDIFRFQASKGLRIPASAASDYSLLGRFGLDLGGGHAVRLTALTSQNQRREFDYQNLYNPQQLNARRDWSSVLTAGWSGPIHQGDGFSIRGEAALSYQIDHTTDGPLTTAGESGSRDPWGGFLVAPLDFRFDATSFSVNDQLVRNFRLNSGRITPYDLSNTTQYQLVDQWRNNAYGLLGFSESGGPLGPLTLYRERRLIGKGVVEFRFPGDQRLRLGAEMSGSALDYYHAERLTSQALSEAYVESPKRQALFADFAMRAGAATIAAALRYDHFRSGASRAGFPRISTAPGFDPAHPTAAFTADAGHSHVSPSVRIGYAVTPRIEAHGSVARVAQLPDFTELFAGINTDLSVTTPSHIYGTDLDFERADLGELGATVRAGRRVLVQGALWTRKDKGVVAVVQRAELDPLTLSNRGINRFVNGPDRTASGLDLRAVRSLGTRGRAWISYGYASATSKGVPVSDSRPHTVAGAVLYQTGADETAAGGVLRDLGIYGAFRLATGTAYTRCSATDVSNAGAVSDAPCPGLSDGGVNAARLPTLKLVDLKLSKGIAVGRVSVSVFADARNLLNTRSVLRVFSQSGSTSSASERSANRAIDVQGLAQEAARNGALQADSSIDLAFGGQVAGGCGAWVTPAGSGATPNCVYLIRAEERFGNGDHLFTRAEQVRASDALYLVGRGLQQFTGSGRRVRVGLEIGF